MKYTPDFSSRFRILKGGKISLVVSALIAGSTMSFASPTGGQVTSGSASIAQNGSVTTINQSTNKASINWNSFSIAPSETVNFVQPSAQSVTLNRVIGTSQSLIEGAMNANGQVFLINPNGVLFSNGSQINVGGLVASTLNITDANFQAGNYVFEGNSQNSIINMGTITAHNGGYVAMMGKTVQNEGTIVATMGNVQMASGEKISLNLNGNSLVKLTIDQGTLNALVENKGLIQADGGQVYLTTQALNTILDGMVNNTGIIEANTLNDVTGKVILFAHGGTANISGSIIAEGGFIETSGQEFSVADGTIIKAKEWLIDPTDITIESSGSTTDLTGSSIKASFIESTLNGGTGVTLTADNDININENLSWNQSLFTLNAGNDINVNAVMNATGTAGLALNYTDLTFKMNADKTGFDGKIGLASTSSIALNSDSYTIISDRAGLEAMDAGYAEFVEAGSGSIDIPTVQAAMAGKYVLASDIDLSGSDWLALGDSSYSFTGALNGLGNTIDGMTISVTDSSSWDKGLFSVVDGGSVSNLALTGVDVSGNSGEYGALAGWIRDASISNMILEGSVKGTTDAGYIGGLAGYVSGATIINNVHADVDVEAKDYVGGLVGYGQDELTITNSSSTGSVQGRSSVGGLVGEADGAIIINESYARNSLSGSFLGIRVGGLVGAFYGDASTAKITNSFADTSIVLASGRSAESVGGLVGELYEATIENSYAIGTISHTTNADNITGELIGGLVGFMYDAKIDKGFADVDINLIYQHLTGGSGAEGIGGLVGVVQVNYSQPNVVTNSLAAGNVTVTTGNLGGGFDEDGLILTAKNSVGGFIGLFSNYYGGGLNSTITNNDSAGRVSLTTGTIGAQSALYASGFIGASELVDDGTISAGYQGTLDWDLSNRYSFDAVVNDITLTGTDIGATKSETAIDATAQGMYESLGFDFTADGAWAHDSTKNGGLPYLKWASSMFEVPTPTPEPTPEPTPTTNTLVQNQVNNLVTTIVNSTTVTAPAPTVVAPVVSQQQIQTQAQNNILLQTIMPQGSTNGGSFGLVGSTDGNTVVQTVSMEELQKAAGAQGISDIRVPLGSDSLVALVNGGLNLPFGVSQEFYVVNNSAPTNTKKAKKN